VVVGGISPRKKWWLVVSHHEKSGGWWYVPTKKTDLVISEIKKNISHSEKNNAYG
jgi:hypothetical protein